MFVSLVSLRGRRAAIAADLEETAEALDSPGIGNIVFATLIDDPANVYDFVDAFTGELLHEAASANDSCDTGLLYDLAIDEPATAVDALSVREAETVAADMVEAATASDTQTGELVGDNWNPADKSANVTLSNANLTASASSATQCAVRSQRKIASGKYYFEVTSTGTITNSGVGIATAAANLSNVHSTVSLAAFVNIANGTTFFNGSSVGQSWPVGALTAGDVVCLAIDHPNQRLWFRKNGGNWNNSGTANPATNTGGFNISAVFTATNTFALVTFASTGLNHTANFGAATFAQTMPSGFSAWNSGAT